jgi:hypothetical protein
MSMRKLVVDGKDFEWVVGKSHVRIRGNGHVTDIRLIEFLKEELNVPAAQAWQMTEERDRGFGVEPNDIVNYIQKHGWS